MPPDRPKKDDGEFPISHEKGMNESPFRHKGRERVRQVRAWGPSPGARRPGHRRRTAPPPLLGVLAPRGTGATPQSTKCKKKKMKKKKRTCKPRGPRRQDCAKTVRASRRWYLVHDIGVGFEGKPPLLLSRRWRHFCSPSCPEVDLGAKTLRRRQQGERQEQIYGKPRQKDFPYKGHDLCSVDRTEKPRPTVSRWGRDRHFGSATVFLI